MNKLIGIFVFVCLLHGCKKEEVTNVELSFVSIINAVPTPALSVYIDTSFRISIPYRATTRNFQLTPGSHILSIRDSSKIKTYLTLPVQEFLNGEASTIVVYDTLHRVDSTVKAIRLSDDLTLAPTGFVKVRFIHAAALTSPVDVTFLRTSVMPIDSVTFSSQKYIGSTTDIQTLSFFNNIPIGNYTLKVKRAGSQDTIMNTLKLSVSNLAGVAGISGITTFYLTGGAQGQPLKVDLFRHYP